LFNSKKDGNGKTFYEAGKVGFKSPYFFPIERKGGIHLSTNGGTLDVQRSPKKKPPIVWQSLRVVLKEGACVQIVYLLCSTGF